MAFEKHWSVWNNKTDQMVCCDLPTRQCCKLLGMKRNSFFRAVCRAKQGKYHKYYFEEQPLDEDLK